MAAIWSELLEELVDMVVEQLECVDDVIRFGAVCKSWRSVSILQNQNKKKVYAPLMILAKAENRYKYVDGVRWFVIPYKGEGPTNIKCFHLVLPRAQGVRCWGSPYGWLFTVGIDPTISLFNPLSGEHLLLPPQRDLQNLCTIVRRVDPEIILHPVYNRKFTLGWHPSSQSWLVVAIFGERSEVAFAFAGNGNGNLPSSSWTYIQSPSIEDVILFRGQIYLMDYHGNLSFYDMNEGTPKPKAIYLAPQPEELMFDIPLYLVEIGGELHLVGRHNASYGVDTAYDYYEFTSHFVVWKFNFSDRKWYELDDLGEYALFLGNNASFAISTATYTDFSRNCIYFTEDFDITLLAPSQIFCDAGVYNYVERTIERFDIANMGGAFSSFGRPIFFMPTL